VKRFGRWLKKVFWTRRALSTTLVVFACLMTLAAAFSIYLRNVVLDTATWTDTSGELLENDEIRPVVANYLVNRLYDSTDVSADLGGALPQALQPLAAPLSGALHELALRTANAFLANPKVQQLWRQANTIAHEKLVAVIEGKSTVVTAQGNQVVLNLGPMLQELAQTIGLPGTTVSKLAGEAQIVVIKDSQLATAKKVANALRVGAFFFLIAAVVLWALAILVGRGRRRETVRMISIGLLIVGLVLVIVRRVFGTAIIDAIVEDQAIRPAGNAAWLIATQALQDVTVILIILGVLGILWAWLCGPTRWAVGVRHRLAPTVRAHPVVFYAIVAVIALILVAWGPLDNPRTYAGMGIILVILVFGIESFRRTVVRELPETAPPPLQS
jgi:hypothetical protein